MLSSLSPDRNEQSERRRQPTSRDKPRSSSVFFAAASAAAVRVQSGWSLWTRCLSSCVFAGCYCCWRQRPCCRCLISPRLSQDLPSHAPPVLSANASPTGQSAARISTIAVSSSSLRGAFLWDLAQFYIHPGPIAIDYYSKEGDIQLGLTGCRVSFICFMTPYLRLSGCDKICLANMRLFSLSCFNSIAGNS